MTLVRWDWIIACFEFRGILMSKILVYLSVHGLAYSHLGPVSC